MVAANSPKHQSILVGRALGFDAQSPARYNSAQDEEAVTQPALSFDVAARARPCAGEYVSGDVVCSRLVGESTFVLVLDATGHGKEAHRVAELAERSFKSAELGDPAVFLTLLDETLRGSRGAVAAVACLHPSQRRLSYAAVGNISGRLMGRGDSQLVFREGSLGQHFRVPKVQTLELEPEDLLVMHSDGISGRFSRDSFPELATAETTYLATQLLERFGKLYDDASCALVRVEA